MGILQKLRGTIETAFQIGIGGPNIAKDTNDLQVKNAAGDALANLQLADGSSADHAATLRQLKRSGVYIQAGVDGASVAAGVNTGKYVLVCKSGGSYTAGQILYDNGTALETVGQYPGQVIAAHGSAVEVSGGTVSLIANGLYMNTGTNTWTLKGDGSGTSTGVAKTIQVDAGTDANNDSTTEIPAGAIVTRVHVKIGATAYSASTTLAVSVNGSTPTEIMATNENDPTVANAQYVVEPMSAIPVGEGGVVRVEIGNTPGQGSAEVLVDYIATTLS